MRWIAGLLVCTMLLTSTGCYSARKVAVHPLAAADSAALAQPQGPLVVGWTDASGQYHPFDQASRVRVRFAPPDSLEFVREPYSGRMAAKVSPARRTVPLADVQMVHFRHVDPARTVVGVIGATVLFAVVALGIIAATKSSCPFIYSWDGTQYVLDGDPYGGATMKSLERTDWSELEHLVPARGAYRLMLTNEVDETQHTNHLDLVLVDHRPGTTAVMDRRGVPHAFRHLAPLASAVDESGRDLMVWLRETDNSVWYPDLAAWSARDSLPDTRNHITLTFAKPAGVRQAWLVTHVATGDWGSAAIRTMLGFRGDRLREFYAAIDGSDVYRKQLYDWQEREELFELFPELWCGDHWTRLDFVPGAGPIVSESRALPFDLGRVTGDTVMIRIHPPIGFWKLNSFKLAWGDEPPRVTRVEPRRASDGEGRDVLAALAAEDDRYLDQPSRQDLARIEYPAPPVPRGTTRTIFAETRGWYEVHVHRTGPPDLAAIARLTDEPGFIVRRSLADFAEFRRTGRVAGVPMDSLGTGSW